MGPVIFVMHHASHEIDYMKRMQIDVTTWETSFPRATAMFSPDETTKVYPVVLQDTQRLFAAHVQDPSMTGAALTKACAHMRIKNLRTDKMHNAGETGNLKFPLFSEPFARH